MVAVADATSCEPERDYDDAMHAVSSPKDDSSHSSVEYTLPDYWEGSRLPSWIQSVVTNTFVFVMTHYNLWLLPVMAMAYYLVVNGYVWTTALLIAMYLPSYLPKTETTADGRQWDAVRQLQAWNLVAGNYLRMRLVRESPLESASSKRYVFGYSPHGILVLSRFAIAGGNWEKLFPGIDFRFLGASAIFSVPLAREACLWLGGVDASRSTAERVLRSGKSIAVYPGGVPEIFHTDPTSKENVLVLGRRMGFIKLAMSEGADLVPTFVFGEKWLYHVWTPSQPVVSFFWRMVRVPMIVFWGRVLWMPRPPPTGKTFGVVYGKPIAVKRSLNPSDEEVRELHAAYVSEVKRLFNDYKASFGYDEDEVLVIT